MPRILRSTLAAFATTAALGAAAQATGEFVDTAHFRIDPATVYAVGGASNQRLAQTLTVEWGGYVAGVFLPIHCHDGLVSVELRDVVADAPGPVIHAAAAVPAADLQVHPARFVYVNLTAKTAFFAGARLSLVVGNAKGSCGFSAGAAKPGYRDGRGFFEASPNPPGFVPFSDFPGMPDDLPFQLVLRPF